MLAHVIVGRTQWGSQVVRLSVSVPRQLLAAAHPQFLVTQCGNWLHSEQEKSTQKGSHCLIMIQY